MKRCGARIVNYADDFVVLCQHGAATVLAEVRRWIVGMKLELNEAKTCLRNAWKENFRFLGYEFGPVGVSTDADALPGSPTVEEGNGRRSDSGVSEILWRGSTERWEDI